MKLLILDEGQTIRCLMVDAGGRTAIVTTDLKRISHGKLACHPSMVRGTYAMHYDGWVNMQLINLNQAPYFAPAVGVGFFRIDPDRGNSGGGTHNWGGLTSESEMTSGAWRVNPDCAGIFEGTGRNKSTGAMMPVKAPLVAWPDGSAMVALQIEAPAFQYFIRVGMQ